MILPTGPSIRDLQESLHHRLVRLPAVDLLIRLALGTQALFHVLHQPVCNAALFLAGVGTHGTFDALLSQFAIPVGDLIHIDLNLPRWRLSAG